MLEEWNYNLEIVQDLLKNTPTKVHIEDKVPEI